MSAPLGTIIDNEQAFLDDVEAFYRQRGTSWERDAKVAGRPISLHVLFKTVMDMGGYDKVSAERMRWRTLVLPFGLGTQHEPAMTFQLKTVYYKNLAAYEIARYWGEEPPPPQILEELTAKGGDLRNRKIETYPLQSRNIDARDSEDEESQKTPVKDKMDPEDPGSGRRYPTRELRQDPKRTQNYQPDPTPQRNRFGRATGSPQASPAPHQTYHSAITDPRNPAFSIESYVPREPMALSLRPVMTPGSSAEMFYQRKASEKSQLKTRERDSKFLDQLKYVAPAAARVGPTIYTRCHMGLMSGIKEEQAFALHHLVKVSHERGDKFTFKGFPGLAEALIQKALEITFLMHGFEWKISYEQEEGVSAPHVLNGCYGTPNLTESLALLPIIVADAGPETKEFADDLERINEAALVIRNMLTLEENAVFLSKISIFKDFLIIAINLPQHSRLTELRYYALEMAEQITRYWALESNDPLYLSLVAELESQDRGNILSSLKAITRIGVECDQVFQIIDFPQSTLGRMMSFVTLDDDELVEVVLDFLYEFTAISTNVTSSLQEDGTGVPLLPTIVPRLASLLLHNSVAHVEKIQNRPVVSRQHMKPQIPEIPNELYMQLLQYPEPERSSRWLRCCFEESPQDDITQIAIWQAYQTKFAQTGHIAAADFIKNVSSTFHQAQAQVINTPPQPRFIIKGIKPRQTLVDVQGRGYFKCLWESTGQRTEVAYDGLGRQRHICGSWHSSRQGVWFHILNDHCSVPRGPDGKFLNKPLSIETTTNGTNNPASTNDANTSVAPAVPTRTYKCNNLSCGRTQEYELAIHFSVHVRGHIPETAEDMAKVVADLHIVPNANEVGMPRQRDPTQDEMYVKHDFYYTSTDASGHPCGIPFMAVMILRNLARFVGRFGGNVSFKNPYSGESSGSHSPSMRRKEKSEVERKQDLMGRIFNADVRRQLWYAYSVHRTLNTLVNDLLMLIDKAETGEKKRVREEGLDTGVEGVYGDEDAAMQ